MLDKYPSQQAAQLHFAPRLTRLLNTIFQNTLVAYTVIEDIIDGAINLPGFPLIVIPQVITSLADLQSAVQVLSRAYITHTNTVIGKGPGSSLELLNLAAPLANDNPLLGGQVVNPPLNVESGEGKKRKRAPHDKNAPKRPVTPYFLYMQTARAIIAAEVGEGHSAKEVADEGTKRWNDMPLVEREVCRWPYNYFTSGTNW